MSLLRDAGYNLELVFVFADEETMVQRAERRAKSTGRITKPDHVRDHPLPPLMCVKLTIIELMFRSRARA